VFAWMRVANPAQQPRLRMAIEGKLDGQVFYKLARVGQGEPGMAVPLTNQWVEYHIPFTDLPTSGLTDFCVGFDLMGEGEVWIDDVEVVESWFESDGKEHAELVKSTFTANEQLSQGELGECWRYIDSYWPSFLRQHVPLRGGGRLQAGSENLPLGDAPLTSRPATGNPPAENRPPAAAPPRAAEQKSWWQSWMKWR
jgi:hypothetical protein